MIYVEKTDNIEKYYSVDYDEEKLKDISEKLKEYSYVLLNHSQMTGWVVTKFPATEKYVKRRVISVFNESNKNIEATIYPETIVYHTGDNYVTYDYSYEKYPDLFSFIGLIVDNNGDFIDFKQLGFEKILNYANSPELTKHDSISDEKEYDYEGLNKLYKETLACFSFNLIAIKEYLKEPEQEDVLKLLLKK